MAGRERAPLVHGSPCQYSVLDNQISSKTLASEVTGSVRWKRAPMEPWEPQLRVPELRPQLLWLGPRHRQAGGGEDGGGLRCTDSRGHTERTRSQDWVPSCPRGVRGEPRPQLRLSALDGVTRLGRQTGNPPIQSWAGALPWPPPSLSSGLSALASSVTQGLTNTQNSLWF